VYSLAIATLLDVVQALLEWDREQPVPALSRVHHRYRKRQHFHQQSGGNKDKSLA
jgi:hypothetical protein